MKADCFMLWNLRSTFEHGDDIDSDIDNGAPRKPEAVCRLSSLALNDVFCR